MNRISTFDEAVKNMCSNNNIAQKIHFQMGVFPGIRGYLYSSTGRHLLPRVVNRIYYRVLRTL